HCRVSGEDVRHPLAHHARHGRRSCEGNDASHAARPADGCQHTAAHVYVGGSVDLSGTVYLHLYLQEDPEAYRGSGEGAAEARVPDRQVLAAMSKSQNPNPKTQIPSMFGFGIRDLGFG